MGVTHGSGGDLGLEVPLGPAAPRAQPQVAAVAVVPAHCSFSAPSRGKARAARSGTQGSAGFWPTRETPHPSLPVAENLRTALPLWKIVEAGQAGFPNLRTGVVQQFPLATQPMNQEDLSDAAVPRPPPV